MNKKLYIGNLSFKAINSDLEKKFSPFGDIEEATIIFDKNSQRSKGFGFVTFRLPEQAAVALKATNGQDFMGRPLQVSEAKSSGPYPAVGAKR